MINDRLRRFCELERLATDGPWDSDGGGIVRDHNKQRVANCYSDKGSAEFIAASRTIPADLVEVIKELRNAMMSLTDCLIEEDVAIEYGGLIESTAWVESLGESPETERE